MIHEQVKELKDFLGVGKKDMLSLYFFLLSVVVLFVVVGIGVTDEIAQDRFSSCEKPSQFWIFF